MNLKSLSTLDGGDPLPIALGAKIVPVEMAEYPRATEVSPGIWRDNSTGRLETMIEANRLAGAHDREPAWKRRLGEVAAKAVPSPVEKTGDNHTVYCQNVCITRAYIEVHAHKILLQEGCGITLLTNNTFLVTQGCLSRPEKGESLLDWLLRSGFASIWGLNLAPAVEPEHDGTRTGRFSSAGCAAPTRYRRLTKANLWDYPAGSEISFEDADKQGLRASALVASGWHFNADRKTWARVY